MIRLPAAQRWPALRVGRQRGRLGRLLEVGVVADDQRVLAAELEADLGQPLAGHARDHAPDRGRAGEADHGDVAGPRPAAAPPPGRGPARRSARRRAGPPRAARRANASAVSGVSSRAFSTAALPQTSAGNTFQATLAIGVLAAMISPATPSGWRTIIALPVGHRGRSSSCRRSGGPRRPRSSPSRSRAPVSPSASLRRLAGLGGDDRGDLVGVALEQLGDRGGAARRGRPASRAPRRAARRRRR